MADTGQKAPSLTVNGLIRSSLRLRTPKGIGADSHYARWARTGIKTRNGSSQQPLRPPMPKRACVPIQPIHMLPFSKGS
jgi:hypothetical protein